MTSRKQYIIILLSLIALVVICFFLLFEVKQVPNVKWTQDYKYDSKDPHGAWTFLQLINKSYGIDSVFYYADMDTFNNQDRQLYINYGKHITIPLQKQTQLLDFLENGNSILFICDYVSATSDTLVSDEFYQLTYQDSLSRVQFLGQDSIEFAFKYYQSNILKSELNYIRGLLLSLDTLSMHQSIAQYSDSLSIFYKRKFSSGEIFNYKDPYNFSNIAATQADYLDHFNQVFSHFDATRVILDRPRKSDLLQSQYADKSPLQYILSQAALAWGYYITLLGVFLFIIFRGKRKQRIIPINKTNDNTSLEYVDTMSQLFLSQKQNRKLVEHIESIFYHNVRKKYFLDRNHRDFTNALTQKSKIDKNEISYVLDKFKNAHDGYEFTDIQLHSLYKKLELIYTKWK